MFCLGARTCSRGSSSLGGFDADKIGRVGVEFLEGGPFDSIALEQLAGCCIDITLESDDVEHAADVRLGLARVQFRPVDDRLNAFLGQVRHQLEDDGVGVQQFLHGRDVKWESR